MEESRKCMGTTLRLVVYAPTANAGRRAMEMAFARAEELNGILSDYQEQSELMRLCAKSGGPPTAVSRELFTVLESAQELARLSDGAFDVTIGPVTRLWRLARKSKRLPDPADLAAARALVGYRMVELTAQGRWVRLAKPGMRIDLGGIAKGFTADELLELLRKEGLPRSLVALGGDITCGDAPPGAQGWEVGIIPAPGEKGAPLKVFLQGKAISTSGDLEQFLEIDGRRYSHIVDARTGIGSTNQAMATVIAPRGIDADRLAKLGVLLPWEKARAIVSRQPETRMRVVLPDGDGRIRMMADPGFPGRASQSSP
jgi:thiamine biosynthesis lipoprotein